MSLSLIKLGSDYEAGDLVSIRFPGKGSSLGVVLDYWPSNVYESASYQVLVDGETCLIDRKYVSGTSRKI